MILAIVALAFQQPVPPTKTPLPAPAPVQALPPISVAPPAPPAPDKVIATVNGQKIYAREVAGYIWEWNMGPTLESFTTLAILQQEADRRKVVVSDSEVTARAQSQLAEYQARLPKGQDMMAALKQRGITMSRLVVFCRTQLLLEKIASLDFKPENYVRVASIIVGQKDETTAALSVALASANAAYDALKKGDPWVTVIQKYSTQEQFAAGGGERGWILIADLPKEIQAEAATAKVNGYLPPAKDQHGVEVFRVEGHGQTATPGEMTTLKSRYLGEIERAMITQLQKNAKIEYSY
jgi:foldase protein PrsA